MNQIVLDAGWEVRRADALDALPAIWDGDAGWLPATVPGVVHQDLLRHGLIADPFFGLEETAAQWIGESDWIYRCRVALAPAAAGERTVLCCDGLDTIADVWLNDVWLGRSENMFVPWRHDITDVVRPGENALVIRFASAWHHGRAREAQHGAHPVWNGDASRVHVRKAQYHYGWDWGPVLLTSGPWLPVRIERARGRIAEAHLPVTLADDHGTATVAPVLRVTGAVDMVRLAVHDPAGALVVSAELRPEQGLATARLELARPALWWPAGYGAQARYTVALTACAADGSVLDRLERRIGIRALQLVQAPLVDEPGSSFVFCVNGVEIFCGGANWIPADSLLPRITPARYRAWVEHAVALNMVMLRVWGGGIYEHEAFYEACDDLGVLVWQDFMFGCGIYPADDAFRALVRAEAEAQVRRLRDRPCLALWCGNNEDYQIAESIGAYDAAQPPDAAGRFPARVIYEQDLPAVVAQLDPARPYWPGSPYAGRTTADGTVGDRHVWDVWHGAMAPYQAYPAYAGRFVSEFGMQALPVRATIEAFTTPDERFPQSRTLDHHNKAAGGPMRLMAYLVDNLRVPADLDGMIYATQVIQAEALAAAYGGWRRRWGAPGQRSTAGALVWQLNDCWPVTSWAITDYWLRPKLACAAVARALAPVALGVLREGASAARYWAVNGTLEPVSGVLEVRRWSLAGALRGSLCIAVTLGPNQACELGGITCAGDDVLALRLLVAGRVVARAAAWPEPLKHQHLHDPAFALERCDATTVRVWVSCPARGVWLAAGADVRWGEQYLDVFPDDPWLVPVVGLGDQVPQVRSLYDAQRG